MPLSKSYISINTDRQTQYVQGITIHNQNVCKKLSNVSNAKLCQKWYDLWGIVNGFCYAFR